MDTAIEKILDKKICFLVELEKKIEEQKIDLVINNGLNDNKRKLKFYTFLHPPGLLGG
jgi:hypothetical protein